MEEWKQNKLLIWLSVSHLVISVTVQSIKILLNVYHR